jgi:hypothetical protein
VEYDGGLSRSKAEDMAARAQGFRDAENFGEVLAHPFVCFWPDNPKAADHTLIGSLLGRAPH